MVKSGPWKSYFYQVPAMIDSKIATVKRIVSLRVVAMFLAILTMPLIALGAPRTESQTMDTPWIDPFVACVARIRPSVVGIGSYHTKDKPTVQYFGTGFVIHDGTVVVTNAHVVEEIEKRERINELRVFFPDTKEVDGRKATLIAKDTFHDVAILRFDGPAAPALRLEINKKPPQGQEVGVMGYPIGFRLGLVPAVHKGIVAAITPAVLPLPSGVKMTRQLAMTLRKSYEIYQLNLVVFPGNSGSPLFDARDGRVWGIINKTLGGKTREHLIENPTGISYAVPAWWIHELVARNVVPTENSLKPINALGD